MALRNLTHRGLEVEVPGGGTFTVRGLGPDMVVSVYNRHAGQLAALFDSAVAQYHGDQAAGNDIAGITAGLIADAPGIMAELIAVASGSKESDNYVDPDATINPDGLTDWERDIAVARSLPLPVQVDALMKIAEVTFTSAMPLPKFLAVVIKMAGATTAALTQPTA